MSVRSTISVNEPNTHSDAQGALCKNEPIEIFPPEIVFRDIEPDQTYEVTVSVRNLCQRVRRVRFAPPKTSKFFAEYETLGSIAGGICTSIVITFETDHSGNFHDEMQIVSEDFAYTLKLHALEPAADIQFESFANLGLTSVFKPKTMELLFKNEGQRGGKVTLNYDAQLSPELTLEPASFYLDSGKALSVRASYVPREVGIFRCPVEVEVEGQEIVRHIDINATCVDHQLSVVAANAEKTFPSQMKPHLAVTSSLNFGHMYHGEAKQIQAFLVNNGPHAVHFNVKIVQGSEEDLVGQGALITTPQEQAKLEMKRVMSSTPSFGTVQAYAQAAVLFECHSKVAERAKGFVHNMMEEGNPGGDISSSNLVDNVIDYFYTAIFTFPDLEANLCLQLQARAVLPNIRLSQNSVFFPDCAVHDRRDVIVKVENANDELSLEFEVERIAQFSVSPYKGKLLPLETKSVNFSFTPNNLGVFHSLVSMSFLKQAYRVPVLLYGKATGAVNKVKTLRGPEAGPQHFQPQRKYAAEGEFQFTQPVRGGGARDAETFRTDYSLQIDQKVLSNHVKQQYVDFLRNSQKQRAALATEQKLLRQSRAVPKTIEEIESAPNLGMREELLRSVCIALPRTPDALYFKTMSAVEKAHDPSRPVKNSTKKVSGKRALEDVPFLTAPTRPGELVECSRVIAPEDLQHIYAIPQVLIFNKVVISCPISKWFTVVNDLKQNIWVAASTSLNEVHAIEPASLIIPPGTRGGFKITLLSRTAQSIEGLISYTINNQHTFNFIVKGKVEPALLALSKSALHFVFEDDNMDESLCEKILVKNECSADTKFTWVLAAQSNFEVEPKEDVVPAGKSRPVIIKFTPALNTTKAEEENLVMRIENGSQCSLKCRGDFSEARCALVQKTVDFGVVAVGLKHEKSATIRNFLRTPGIFHIKSCPPEVDIAPTRGKIPGDGKVNLRIEFCSQEEQKLNIEVEITIRGGKSLLLPLTAHAIVPVVYIREPELDFKGVTYKCSAVKSFVVVNESPIDSVIYINLEDHPEFEITMPLDSNEGEVESMILVPALGDRQNPFISKLDEDELDDLKLDAQEEESDEEPDEAPRMFRLQLNPNSNVTLQLKFTPSDTETYNFNLPVLMAGISEPLKSLTRPVAGEGLLPRFLIDPSVVSFKKKYITLGEKGFPDYKDVIFSNPDIYPLKWKLDTSSLDSEKIFSIKPVEGYLEPAGSVTVRVGFTPQQPVEYEERIYLYIDKAVESYLDITLRGEGAIPRISFDRRQVILPIVPLSIQSKAVFHINNEGYQNVELRYRFIKDIGKIPLAIACPDGLNLGATRQRIPIEISFTSERPLSFITWVEFYDGEGNRFTIPIQGTTDNSLFTNYPFLQRHLEDTRIEISAQGKITLLQEVFSDTEEPSGRWGHGARTSGASSVYSRSAKNIVGYHPIPTYLLEKGQEHITRWLNHSVLPNTITKFPDDFVNTFGAPLYELIAILFGKSAPGQVKAPHSLQAKELARQLHRQYEELLEHLKRQGAWLNTVRPEFLLSQADYMRFLKSTPLELQLTNKQVQHRWPYLSMDAWTTVIYQILKLYLLNRVTPRSLKALPGIRPELGTVDATMSSSNLFSLPETILLKWLTYHYSLVYPQDPRRITNFDQDLMDGTVVAAVIQSHVGTLKAFSAIKTNPTSDEQRLVNCEKVIAVLSDIGLPTFFTPVDLSRPSAREAVLFVLKLYNGLPHYLPKAQVLFSCHLGEKVSKKIELSNPSNKSISYWVRLEGSADYSTEGFESITLSPKSTGEFTVFFSSRITNPAQRAKLSFTNRSSEGGSSAAALVFELVSEVKPPVQMPILEINAPLYKLVNKEIDVKNTYGQEAEFNIQLVALEEPKRPIEKKGFKRVPGTEPAALSFPTPFFVKSEKLKVKKNSTSYISLQFLPFEVKTHRAELILCDERVGELHFLIIGTVGSPEPLELPALKAEMGDSVTINVPIDAKNKSLEHAKAKCRERYQSNQKAKERETVNEIFRRFSAEDASVFEVTLNSPFFNGPNTLSMSDPGRGKSKLGDISQLSEASKGDQSIGRNRKSGGSRASQSSLLDTQSKLALVCSPRSPGEYHCLITLSSLKKTDLRVYALVVQVKPKRHLITLEMNTYARTEITQEIPIVNHSDRDWPIKINLIQDLKTFTVNKDLTVKRATTGHVVVTFAPDWVCAVSAKLNIEIPATNESHEFILKGTAEEPRAEQHLEFSAKVKEQSFHLIEVPNHSDSTVRYRVETDMDIASGDPELIVPARSKAEYELVIRPIQSGVYTGAITFFDLQDRFYWYTLEARALEPEPEAERTLTAQCRRALEFKLTVFNPYDEETTFEVTIEGEGLIGDSVFSLAARETGAYELLYSPLVPGDSFGSISFISEKTGEFWYKLRLVALEPEPVVLDTFECELGRSTLQRIMLENPTGEEVHLIYSCSNTLNYELVPDKVVLLPYDTAEAHVKYSPSTLKNDETGEIRLASKLLGDWILQMTGRGLPPGRMPVTEITATLDESSSTQIAFKNPFRDQIEVALALEASDSTFQLLVKRSKFVLGPLSVLLVPVSYYPRSMEDYAAELVVSITEELTWRYPIKGVTVSPSSHIDFTFKAKCRTVLESPLAIYLTELGELPGEDNFNCEISVHDRALQGYVDKSFIVEPVKNIISSGAEPLQFLVKFEPLRPFRGAIELVVTKASGGRWIYNVLLEALEPDTDDTISIESPIGKTASVSFKLTNQFKNFAEFEAFFTPESDACFVVHPLSGVLEPFGRDGTTFIVSYTPVEYGVPKVGKLVIQTEDMRWTYAIKGSHPHYNPPEVSGGRIDNRLKRQLVPQSSKKNFIRGNIRNTSPSKKSRLEPSASVKSPLNK